MRASIAAPGWSMSWTTSVMGWDIVVEIDRERERKRRILMGD
jgi:hypothetical protein